MSAKTSLVGLRCATQQQADPALLTRSSRNRRNDCPLRRPEQATLLHSFEIASIFPTLRDRGERRNPHSSRHLT